MNPFRESRTAAILTASLFVVTILVDRAAAEYRTKNFTVTASGFNDNGAAEEVIGDRAEFQRASIASYWTGSPLPNWSRPCVLKVINRDHAGGGQTKFDFKPSLIGRTDVVNWRMQVEGRSVKVICDSVLPHEITHTINACIFRAPLHRWYDEGIASYCETDFERGKLYDVAKNGDWEFSRILGLKEYPQDSQEMLTIYGVGLTTVEVLMNRGDQEDLIRCGHIAMASNWGKAISEVYGATLDEIEDEVRDFREHKTDRPQFSLVTGVMYKTTNCLPCIRAQAALKSPRFRGLGVTWTTDDVGKLQPIKGNQLVFAPDFIIGQHRYREDHDDYDEELLYKWVSRHAQRPPVSPGVHHPEQTNRSPCRHSLRLSQIPWFQHQARLSTLTGHSSDSWVSPQGMAASVIRCWPA